MALVQLFVGSTNRLYFAGAYTLNAAGAQTEFTNSTGSVTAQILSLDQSTQLTAVLAMTYSSGSAVVNGTTYASGNWSVLIPSNTPLVVGTQYVVQLLGTISGNSIPDLTLVETVAAAYAT